MLFGLIATVMLSVSSFGQTNEEISKVYNENRPVFAKLMSDFTTKLKPSYSKGMTYEAFIVKTALAKELSTDGNVILKKAFSYLQTGATDESIQKNETGYEIAVAYLNYTKANSKQQFEDYLFGQSNNQARGFWSSLWQGIKDLVTWVWDNAQEIMQTYVQCCNLHICCR